MFFICSTRRCVDPKNLAQFSALKGNVLVVRRIGRGKGARGLEVLAVLKNSAKDQPISPMEATVSTIATARFLPAFSAAIEVGRLLAAR